LCLFIYALEKLRSGRRNDCIGISTSAFTDSKIVPGGSVYWNRDGINSLKCTVLAASVATVIAKSFARIFYRNAINNGFYLI